MTDTRSFHVGDLLSITTGCLVSPDHIDGVYKIVDFVTGQPHFTHQLPRAAEAVKPWLIEQHPWLDDITPPEFDGEAEVWTWLAVQASEHGERHEVRAMPFGMYIGREPLAELNDMVGPERVIPIVIETEPDGSPT